MKIELLDYRLLNSHEIHQINIIIILYYKSNGLHHMIIKLMETHVINTAQIKVFKLKVM